MQSPFAQLKQMIPSPLFVVVALAGFSKIPRAHVSKFFLSSGGFCFCFFSKQTFLDTFTDGRRAPQFC
jgi:hypothetical protein